MNHAARKIRLKRREKGGEKGTAVPLSGGHAGKKEKGGEEREERVKRISESRDNISSKKNKNTKT